MIKRIRKAIANESGQTLLFVLVLLCVGGIMLMPMLSYMGTGLHANQTYEIKTEELYAADSGVEDAIWKVNHLPDSVPENKLNGVLDIGEGEVTDNYLYNIADVNGYSVGVEITLINWDNGGTYLVISEAGGTRIDAIITSIWLDYSGLLDNAITSPGSVTLQPGSDVIGGIVCPDPPDGNEDQYDEWIPDTVPIWPEREELIAWYMRDVEGVTPYPSDLIELMDLEEQPGPGGDDRYLPPIYKIGNLNITSNKKDKTLFLGEPPWQEGDPLSTVYITGDLVVSKDFILDLNGQTIFVEGNVDISPQTWLDGNGCIIAIGDVTFSPQMATDPDEFIFVCSLEGTVYFGPQGDFSGTIAGNIEVQLQPGTQLEWLPPPDGLNFPDGSGGGWVWGIQTWEIS